MSFGIVVCIYCHNIPTCTPQSWYHRVTNVTKNTDIAKMAENRINCKSAHPLLRPHKTYGVGTRKHFFG